MYHSFFIHSSVDGHLGCFHVLVIVNNATVNIRVHMSFSILVSSGYIPSGGMAGSCGGLISSFLKTLHTVFYSGCINLHSHHSERRFLFSTPFPALLFVDFLIIAILTKVRWYLIVVFLFIYYWKIIALQNFAVFCQTSIWISHRYTYISFLLKLPPISIPILPLLGWYRAPVWVS